MNLEELKQKRLKWVEASRENDFERGIGRLLTDLYPDNAHFIYELLQNAEDAQATEVRFILQKDRVEFEHNGDRLFSIEDVDAITGLGITTKKDDPTNIGEFGVGFKAVFAYTATPEIKSGAFHFRIRDLVVPDTEGLAPRPLGEKETRFSFPFNNPRKPPKTAYAEIVKNLRQLDESTLLFLGNIRKIEYLLSDSTLGFLERKETKTNRIEILVQHPEESEPVSVPYLLFEKEVDVNVDVNDEDGNLKRCRIAIAFGLEKTQKEEWRVKLLTKGQVCIYFPAEKETSNLRFHLHAPFASTVARDSVRACEANDNLRNELAELIAGSMATIRDQGLLNVGFLAKLPNEEDNLSLFYKPIMDRLIEVFQNEKLTPMKQGGHAAANGIFRGLVRLSDFISDNDLAMILGEEYSPPLWIANPPQRNQREDNFLIMLGIPDWTIGHLVDELSIESETIMKWLAGKSADWHQRLYMLLGDFLSNAPSHPLGIAIERKSALSNLRIVSCGDGIYRVGGECYFPSDGVERDKVFPRVAPGVYSSGTNKQEQEKARKFLEDIGVSEVGEADRVETILKQRYSQTAVDNNNFCPEIKDVKRFMALLEKCPSQAELFGNYFIFKSDNDKWRRPSQVYLDSPYLDTGLRAYYEMVGENSVQKRALSPEYKEYGTELEKFGKFAEDVGAQTQLTPQKQEIPYKHPQRAELTDTGGWSWEYGIDVDYDIQELDVLLAQSDLSKSQLIWKTMNELPECCLIAKYSSNSRYPILEAHSTLVHKLSESEWVPQQQDGKNVDCFLKPSEAVPELLPEGFSYEAQAPWLRAIEFGKKKQDREEAERRRAELATDEYRRRSDAAKEMGFSSPEEVAEMAELRRKDPEGYMRWKESAKNKPEFPERPSRNPERREARFAEQSANAPEKEYETRPRSVRTSRASIDPKTWLRNLYTNDSDQMVCQICKSEMPFRKRDGEHYFEAVEALSLEYFGKEQDAQFLALCPLCAAMYQEFVKRDEEQEAELYQALQSAEGLEVPVRLGEGETSVRFVEIHLQDMKTVLHVYQE